MHLKLKVISSFGSFLISSSFKASVSPFFLMTYSFHAAVSKSLPRPIFPLNRTLFTAWETGYVFVRGLFEKILLKISSFVFNTSGRGCRIPPPILLSGGCRCSHFHAQIHPPK